MSLSATRWSTPGRSGGATRADRPAGIRGGRGGRGRGAAPDAAFERHPFLEAVLAGNDRGQDGLHVARLGLRQEPDLAEVDADQRHVDLGDGHRRPQERSVATEHHQDVRRRQLLDEPGRVAGGQLPFADPADAAPARGARAELDRGIDRRVVGEADPGDGHQPATSAMRSPISAQPGPGARWTRNSRLPSGPKIGEAMTARVPSPAAAASHDDPVEDLAMDRRVADDAVVRPATAGLELWLDEGDDVAPVAERAWRPARGRAPAR